MMEFDLFTKKKSLIQHIEQQQIPRFKFFGKDKNINTMKVVHLESTNVTDNAFI